MLRGGLFLPYNTKLEEGELYKERTKCVSELGLTK